MKFEGYACPFGLPAMIDDQEMVIEKNAFIRPAAGVALVAFDHDSTHEIASTADGGLVVEADAYGLRFSADLPPRIARQVCINGNTEVSPRWEIVEESNENGWTVIKRAHLLHVCIAVGHAAWGALTGCWPEGADLSAAPRHIRNLEAKFATLKPHPLKAVAKPIAAGAGLVSVLGMPRGLFDPTYLARMPAGARKMLEGKR
jgi:hypothetical protein